jgi:hypothetical protein
MHSEAQAFQVWWSLHPTLADVLLLVSFIGFTTVCWIVIVMNKKERAKQIDEIKTLVLENIKEIKDSFTQHIKTMKEVVEKLQNEKQMIQEHLVRHEKIAEDIMRICKTIDDHEMRVRDLEWDGKERRRGE